MSEKGRHVDQVKFVLGTYDEIETLTNAALSELVDSGQDIEFVEHKLCADIHDNAGMVSVLIHYCMHPEQP